MSINKANERQIIDSFRGDYAFLSNFYPCTIFMGGKLFGSVENAYQALKTFDPDLREKIRNVKPGEAKKLGREVKDLDPNWDTYSKYKNMLFLLKLKFSNDNLDLKKRLLATNDAKLVEKNTWGDTCWGVCNGVGNNWLGKMLMLVRSQLKEERGLLKECCHASFHKHL